MSSENHPSSVSAMSACHSLPGLDGPCPELGGDFDLPARVFERRQRGRNKLLPARSQVAAVEQKDARAARAAFGGKPHHRETALAQPIECGRLAGTVATVKDDAVRITGELPFVLRVDAHLAIDLAIEKAKLGDIDRRAGLRADGRGGLEQGQMGNWLALDDDRGGRGQIAFGGRLVWAAAHLSSPRGGARMARFGDDEPRATDRTGLGIDIPRDRPLDDRTPF